MERVILNGEERSEETPAAVPEILRCRSNGEDPSISPSQAQDKLRMTIHHLLSDRLLERIPRRQVKPTPVLFFIVILLILAAPLLSGCVTLSDPEASQEYRAHTIGSITQSQTIGQTFVSRRPRLENILIWYQLDVSTAPQDGQLTVELFHNPGDAAPIKSIPFSFNQLLNRNNLSIPLSIVGDPPGQAYFIQFKVNKGTIHLYGRDEDAYPQGSAYLNGSPQNSDLSFRLSYDYNINALLLDLKHILQSASVIVLLLAMLWLPGRLLLGLLDTKGKFDPVENFALSTGLSLAVVPLVMLWTSILNFQLNRTLVITVFLLMVILYFVQNRSSINPRKLKSRLKFNPNWIVYLTLIGIFTISLVVRFGMVRDMAAPAWVDSVHHAMLTNLIVENGGFPETYAPFLNSDTVNYHLGFHSIVAVFQWLTEVEIVKALLLMGQVLNALFVFSAYLFTKALTRSRIAGIFAGLAVGLLTPMPAYYTSWGRYTQLAGLLILPTAFALVLLFQGELSGEKGPLWERIRKKNFIMLTAVTAVAFAGLTLTHYRVSAFLAFLLVAHFLVLLVKTILIKDPRHYIPALIGGISVVAILAFLITLPWWPETFSSLLIPRLTTTAGTPTFFSDFSWAFLSTALGQPVMLLAVLGLIIGIIQLRSFVFTLLTWIVLLFTLANLGPLGLPGAYFINNSSVVIMLFLPISVLAGYFISWVISLGERWLIPPWRHVFWVSTAIAGVFITFLGARTIMPILNQDTMLFRNADFAALDWIKDNTPPDETVLINPFSWGYGMYAGNDGGYWITPLSYRKSMPPPALYGLSVDLFTQVNQVSKNVIALSDDIDSLHAYLWENDLHYIYVGARGGALSPRDMNDSPLFDLLYDQDGTWVFQTLSP